MGREIVVLGADENQCRSLCNILEERHYPSTSMYSLGSLEEYIKASVCPLVIIDLDNLPVGKHTFRRLKRLKPSLCIMGLSSKPFHPELEEAMSSHIYACIKKPVDEEELIFWVKSLV